MKKLRWQILIAVAALVAVAVLLFGQTQVDEPFLSEPTGGGVYVEGLVGAPGRFNPLLDRFNPVDRDVDRLIFSRLIQFDSYGNPVPDLAETFGVSVTGDVYNVSLRENATWHDGVLITTQDVLFTIEMMRNGEMPISEDLRELWNSVEVTAFDALNMQFRLEEPYSPFIDYLSFGILPSHLYQGKSPQEIISDPLNLAPVGSGPYKFVELRGENGQINGVVLEAFEDYYLGPPLIEQVIFRYFNSTQEALAAYRNGELLGIGYVDPLSLEGVLEEPGLNVYTARLPQMSMVLLNLDNSDAPFFADGNVRKALMMALNRAWIIDRTLEGQGMVAHSPIFPGSWAYYEGVDHYPYDPEEAIRLLKEAEYILPPDGGTVRVREGVALFFDLVYPDDQTHTAVAGMIREYWNAVGVGVNLIPVDPGLLVQDYLDPRAYDAALVDITLSGSPDPDPYPFWHQAMITGGQNYAKWDDRRASEYLERARVTPNRFERMRLYRNFQVHFSRELPALLLYYPMYNYAVDNEVAGVQLGPIYDPSDRFKSIYKWSLEARPGGDGAVLESE